MAGPSIKKRSFADGPKGKAARPTKKQRQAAAYHSSSEDDESDNDAASDKGVPVPAGLFDSDDDLENLLADDGASSGDEGSGSESSQSESERKPVKKSKSEQNKKTKKTSKETCAKDAPDSSDDDSADDKKQPQTKKTKRSQAPQDPDSDVSMDSDDDDEDQEGNGSDDDPFMTGANRISTKSKRNDSAAFATSISKMLSSKLPVSKRADPIVARSAEAAVAASQVVDSALESKARKRLREQKRLALEKGRVRDVLMPSTTRKLNFATGEIVEEVEEGALNTSEIVATEMRLRKVAQRGVVKLFNAVRAAQVKATEAQRAARQEGIVGSKRREEKVTEMSRQGFLDLIATGGGGLKKGGLEEA